MTGALVLAAPLAAALLSGAALAGEPTRPDAQTILSRALTQARETHIAPFLRYTYSVSMIHKSKTKSYSYVVLERMSDHYGRFTSLNPDGTESQGIHLHTTLVSPGMFLNSVADDVGETGGLQPIGSVVASPYSAVLAGAEATDACPNAYKLVLTPKGDPERHALRELWIEADSYRICRATIHKTVYIVSREPILMDVQLDGRELIRAWSFAGTGHLMFGTYSIAAQGHFADVTNVPAADDTLFR